MIMSPFVLDRNVPLIGPPKGGQIGADRNEQRGVRKSGSAGAGAEQAAARGGCGATDACELPAGEAVVEALSGGRGHGTEARQRGAIVESRSRCEVPKEGAAAGAGEVRWAGGRAFRTDAGGGTLGVGGWAEGGCRNAATLDVGGRAVESRAEAPAASSTTWAQLGEQETIWAVADGLRAWIARYGVPLALYVDWKNLYKRPATPGERLRGEEPITQFGRMCAKLDIEVIAASSPQAKGRVERVHGTHQDRLVKKLRRKGIISHE